MKKYLINVLGIGDLIFFCGTILLNHKKGETIEIHLSKNILKLYRDNSNEYEKFCYEYIKYFLEDYNLKILSNPTDTNYVFEISSDICQKVINNDEVRIIIQNKLNNTQSKYDNYIVIFTKVRDLNYDNFINSSKDFFNKINNFSGNIILLGEQEIKYTGEYEIHGKNLIYSIYDHCVKNIKPEKIIDLTTNLYDFSGFSLSNILKDCNIISNSTETYVFGGGGFFCLSLFTNKLVSLTNNNHKNIFYSDNNPRIFSDINEFNSHINKIKKMKETTYSSGDHKLTSLSLEILSNFINPIFFETGTNTGLGVSCAIKSGFKKVYSIDIEERYYEMSLLTFQDKELYDGVEFNFFLGDSGIVMPEILKNIDEKITFWLDGHEFYKIPLINELESIKNHKIKGHTILIDDVRMLTRPEWNNIGLESIISKIKEIDERYEISFVDSVNGKNDILIAKINE